MGGILAFRFDVDTELCLREGVPRLLDLGEEFSVYFTFFINPGAAIRRRDLLRRRRGAQDLSGPKLSAVAKLGVRELSYLVALNPRPLPRHEKVTHRMQYLGHEIGLHGGRNHGDWARNAQYWSGQRLASEVEFGVNKFLNSGIKKPYIFASPGWNSPSLLPSILRDRGFLALADSHGLSDRQRGLNNNLATLHTALTGEPGGIGYIEFMRAQGATDEVILEDFVRRLERETGFACVYDHPFYAGRQEIKLIRKMIRLARDQGWRVEPMGSALSTELP